MIKIKPILPQGVVFDVRKAKHIIDKNMKELADNTQAKFENVTSSWNTKVPFKQTGTPESIGISTDNKVFHYVNSGTRPHKIVVGGAKMLQLKTGYKAKTTPNSLGVGGGGSGGKAFRKSVNHPGSEARRFDNEILKEVGQDIKKNTEWFKDL